MMTQTKTKTITSIVNNGEGQSIFSSREIDLNGAQSRLLSDQISALNFRIRESGASYASDWHVAGDPTLLVVLAGIMRIELRNGGMREFAAGDMFVAEDYLPEGVPFDDTLHGHRAEVIGDESLSMIHIKLDKRID